MTRKNIARIDMTYKPPAIHYDDGDVGHAALPVFTPRMPKAEIEKRLSVEGPCIVILRNGLVSFAYVSYATDPENPADSAYVLSVDDLQDGNWDEDGGFAGFCAPGEDLVEVGGPFDVVYVAPANAVFKLTAQTIQQGHILSKRPEYAEDVRRLTETLAERFEDGSLTREDGIPVEIIR